MFYKEEGREEATCFIKRMVERKPCGPGLPKPSVLLRGTMHHQQPRHNMQGRGQESRSESFHRYISLTGFLHTVHRIPLQVHRIPSQAYRSINRNTRSTGSPFTGPQDPFTDQQYPPSHVNMQDPSTGPQDIFTGSRDLYRGP